MATEVAAKDHWDDLRADFPILGQEIHGQPLTYLDNAATSQVPEPVLNTLVDHYHRDNANVHRGAHALSERSTRAFEEARCTLASFLGAADSSEVVFTSGTTDSLNSLARLLEPTMGPKDRVVVTALEHHANFVPWQQLCRRTGATFEVAPLTAEGDLDQDALESLLAAGGVRLVCAAQVSNVLGAVTPIEGLATLVHAFGAQLVVDAAQAIRHEPLDVRASGVDFLAFSGHKMCAPGGTGILYARRELWDALFPVNFGGEMVDRVRRAETSFEGPPLRFEAGTPNYPGSIALAAAARYLEGAGREMISEREHELTARAESVLDAMDGVCVLGRPTRRAGCVSFVVEGVHPFDVATLLDARGVAVRSGNLCAQPLLHETLGIQNVVRVSPAFYNTEEEIDRFAEELERVLSILRR